MLFASFATFSQTYPIHDVDDCKLMLNSTNANTTYTVSVANPIPADASVNVSSISASANNGNAQFSLPYSIEAGPTSTIDWSGRFYSANAGANTTGSGKFIVRLLNRTVGGAAGNFVQLALANKTGGAWQTESGSGVVLNPTNAAAINAAGGFNTILILASSNAASIETLFFDNIELSKNYNLTDDTADLLANNVWVYNNRVGDNKIDPASAFNITVDENISTPTTTGNSSSNVLRVTRGAGATTLLQFNHGDINPTTAGFVKFRVFIDCQSPYTNRIKYFLRKDGVVETQKITKDYALVAGVWNEVVIDLSTMIGSGTVFNNSLFLFDSLIESEADGDIYYLDAIQMPASTANFDGNAGSDWNTAANWSDDTLPNGLFNVTIPAGQNVTIGSTTGAKTNNLTVDGAGSLSVTQGGSLIAYGTATGNITYNTAVTDDSWHLIGGAFTGQAFDNTWASNNGVATSTVNTSLRGVSAYQNATIDATYGPWLYLQTDNTNAGTFDSGKGFAVKNTNAGGGTYAITGTYATAPKSSNITIGTASAWNLVANPFSSYIDIAAFLTENASPIADAFESVYVWNAGTSAYQPLTSGYLQPGQGFFVNSASASTSVNFTAAMMSHQTGITFYKENKTTIDLQVSDAMLTKSTNIEYINGKTTGLDPRFDIGLFDGVASDLRVYTHLVSNNSGIKFMKQALPNSDYENMVIPVGVKAAAEKEITFTANAMNLPSDIKVFLEDRANNTFTDLSNNGSYKVSTTKALNGIGRFYLHTKSSTLSVDDSVLNTVSIYKTSNSNLRLSGLSQGKSTIKVYNTLGIQVMQNSFDSNGVKDITLPKLSKGVYIIHLTTAKVKLNKKILIE